MAGPDNWTALGALLLLRVGTPLVITLLVGYWLARLDRRWQADARRQADLALSLAPARRPCWEVRGCDPAKRATCPAFQNSAKPCWLVFREARGRLPERCFSCDIFLSA